MADISLSKAVRANLLSLKGTADMMATTQNRLATGNKVNSALDNPSSWFTAKGLTNRASDLGALIDSMANGIQTLQAADNGLSAMTKTLESMQSTLRQARQDKSFQTMSFDISDTATGDITFSGGAFGTGTESADLTNSTLTPANLGMTAVINGTAGTAGPPATAGSAGITWAGNAVEVNANASISFTATIDGAAQAIEITRDDVVKYGSGDGVLNSASEFASVLTGKLGGAVSATAVGNAITVTSATTGTSSDVDFSAATINGSSVYSTDEMVVKINDDADLSERLRASNDNGKLRIENQSTQKLTIEGATSAGIINGSTSTSEVGGNSVRADLASQFNELRDQLDKLADDASFNGINLLRGDLLTITFNETGTSAIDIQTDGGDTINALNLGVPTELQEKQLDSDGSIDNLLTRVKAALDQVRSQASTFGSNLSIVQNRKSFTEAMINTLETGAGNLTLADMNTEAANLLALQTRQQLSQNSLSLASQADQSILQLLQ